MRGAGDNPERIRRFNREADYMKATWGDRLTSDPYYSPNLTLEHENFFPRLSAARRRARELNALHLIMCTRGACGRTCHTSASGGRRANIDTYDGKDHFRGSEQDKCKKESPNIDITRLVSRNAGGQSLTEKSRAYHEGWRGEGFAGWLIGNWLRIFNPTALSCPDSRWSKQPSIASSGAVTLWHCQRPAMGSIRDKPMLNDKKIAVVLPCYKSKEHVIQVISSIGKEVYKIIVVDDGCPERTGSHVAEMITDGRVEVIYHERNKGVGAAVVTGYIRALELCADIVVKIDSDGQMDPAFIPTLTAPILNGVADYCKGNRFFDPRDAGSMPVVRIVGNVGLSFMTKLSSGYWNLFDPTNGYTAIHRCALESKDRQDKREIFL